MNINTAFGNEILKQTHKLVKQHFPSIKVHEAWVYKTDRQSWEFHGPDNFYWYGRASGAYEARANGWFAYLRKMGVEE